MEAQLSSVIMQAQNPHVQRYGPAKGDPALLNNGVYSGIAHWQVLDGTFDVDAAVSNYEATRALQRHRMPKLLDAKEQRKLLYAKETNPNFVRGNSQKSLDALRLKPPGAFFIRPSSKDNVVVMHYVFAKGMLKAVEISDSAYEPRDDKLSNVLKIEVVDHHGQKAMEEYESVQEIEARFLDPMIQNVMDAQAHRKFNAGTEDMVAKELKQVFAC